MLTRRHAMIGAGTAVLAGAGYYAFNRGPSYDEVAEAIRTPMEPGGNPGLEYLVHHATLAANSHNTQPWLFDGSDSLVRIRPDFSRATPAADPDNHHLFASLGCACENLALAAGAAGRSSSARFVPEAEGHMEIDIAGKTGAADPLFEAIAERQCTRSEYDGSTVSSDDLALLEKAATVDGCRLILIPDPERMEQALEFIVAANTVQVNDAAFVKELKSWLRFNAAHAIATRDGLYGGCSGNPDLPRWIGNLMFGFVFSPEGENDRYAAQIRSSSGLAVFVSDADDKEHWVQAGRSYQRFALQATTLGIRQAFVNQPVEVAAYRREFADWLGIGDQRPDLMVRYGYAPPMPGSLRRPVREVISA